LAGASASDTSASGNFDLDEWKEARGILSRFDSSLADLRKYSFSFITALLTANGLLSQGSSSYSPPIRATVLFATFGLIVAVKLLDKEYRLFQQAASVRARILENRMNVDITTDIATYYDAQSWGRYVAALYFALIFLAGLVGVSILWQSWTWLFLVVIAGLLSAVSMEVIEDTPLTAMADWSVDKFILKEGEPIRITFTNLDPSDKEDIRRPENSVYGTFALRWKLSKYGEPTKIAGHAGEQSDASDWYNLITVNTKTLDENDLCYLEPRDWLWTDKASAGLYLLEMDAQELGTKQGRKGSVSYTPGNPLRAPHNVKITVQITPKPPPSPPQAIQITLPSTKPETGEKRSVGAAERLDQEGDF